MKWKTAFKIALLHPFRMVQSFFERADPPLISEAGEKELQRQALIKMMKQDQEAGLYNIETKQQQDESNN